MLALTLFGTVLMSTFGNDSETEKFHKKGQITQQPAILYEKTTVIRNCPLDIALLLN